jgi:glycosyltransferase involved in cell wall biosynthesis
MITVIIPTYKTPLFFLWEAIRSVTRQTYENWELIIVDDNSSNKLLELFLSRLSRKDPRINVVFRKTNGHISAAINTALEKAKGTFFTILDHDDTLEPCALSYLANAIVCNPTTDYIYSDENKLSPTGLRKFAPFFKPDWNPELFLAYMYTCHLSAFRTERTKEIGGFRSEFDGAQDYDLALRITSSTSGPVIHIPKVLYNWRFWNGSTAKTHSAKPYAAEAARLALVSSLSNSGTNFQVETMSFPGVHRVRFFPLGNPKVSIVIPTANKSLVIDGREENHLDAILDGILNKTNYSNFEIFVVHNGNLTEAQIANFKNSELITSILYEGETLSIAKKINLGAQQASGEFILILNDDIRITDPDWLREMVGMGQRPGIGVVTPKLLFPNGRIQHSGVTFLNGIPTHPFHNELNSINGYGLSAKVSRSYSAVTGACSLTPRATFESLGGYSEDFALDYNDIDYCLRAAEKGLRSVCLASVELVHFEGASVSGDRINTGKEKFLKDWFEKYQNDPQYSKSLNQSVAYLGAK